MFDQCILTISRLVNLHSLIPRAALAMLSLAGIIFSGVSVSVCPSVHT